MNPLQPALIQLSNAVSHKAYHQIDELAQVPKLLRHAT